MNVQVISQQSPTIICRWPQDLAALNLNKEDASIIEAAVIGIWNSLSLQDNSSLKAHGVNKRCRFAKVNQLILTADSESKLLPRSVFVTHDRAIVILDLKKGVSPLPDFADQRDSIFVWDLVNGEPLIKNKMTSEYQAAFYRHLMYGCAENEKGGYAEIAAFQVKNGSVTVYEKCYPMTLARSLSSKFYTPQFLNDAQFLHLMHLQNALKMIHSHTYRPPMLQHDSDDVEDNSYGAYEGPCYHGDVSPHNIWVEAVPDVPNCMKYRLVNYGVDFNPDQVHWKPGWGSPETIKAFVTKKRYQNLTPREFNQRHGQVKDTWAMALIIGSLLRGGFRQSNTGMPLPAFNFIVDRIKFGKDSVDETGLAKLKQTEVDSELETIIRSCDESDQAGRNRKQIWTKVIKAWLIVNPEERRDISQAHFTIGGY